MLSLGLFPRLPCYPFPAACTSNRDTSKIRIRVNTTTASYTPIDNIGVPKVTTIATTTALPEGLKPELMPKHVGVIMDGNRRWAKENGLTVGDGHRAGGKVIKELAYLCAGWGVKVVSVFAFSTENWIRPQEEVDFLMSYFEEGFQSDLVELISNGFRASFIGNKSRLPECLQDVLSDAEETRRSNHGLHLVIALNYSGRYDILQAAKSIPNQVKHGLIQVQHIDESLFEQHLQTNVNLSEFPHPDLLIRTSGEQRISNFMLWQLAYTELCFVQKMFPDFGEEDFIQALSSFQTRQRRFGGHRY